MKKRALFFVAFITSLLVISCSAPISKRIDGSADTCSISVKKALNLIQGNKDNPNFILLDVRKTDDFKQEHIAKAINIDFKSDSFSFKLDKLDKNKTYLINCYGGFRSKNTMELMSKKGFTKLYNMKGGFMKWRAKGYPTVKE